MPVDPGAASAPGKDDRIVAFGLRVQELREAAGISQATGARRAGITKSAWNSIEVAREQGRNRQRSMPRVPVVRAIADALAGDDVDYGLRVELLELAGHHDDAIQDRLKVRAPAAANGDAADLVGEIRRLIDVLTRQAVAQESRGGAVERRVDDERAGWQARNRPGDGGGS